MSERLSVIAVSCFEIARRDANVYFLFRLVVGSVGCHFGIVYDALGKTFLASGQLAGFWQLHVGVSFFVGVGITIGIADCTTLAVGVCFVFRLSILRLCLRMRFFMLVIQLQLTRTGWLLKSLCSLFEGGKCLSIRFRNVCATLVLTFLL
jgi:hypothetical protein